MELAQLKDLLFKQPLTDYPKELWLMIAPDIQKNISKEQWESAIQHIEWA